MNKISSSKHTKTKVGADEEFQTLKIGKLQVWPPVVLAPMAGVTDTPFRELCSTQTNQHKSKRRKEEELNGIFVNQMITARALVEKNAKTLKLTEFGQNETLRSVQLYGTDTFYTAKAVRQLIENHGAEHIDMNFGCPVPKITKHGGGGVLPYCRPLFKAIVESAVKAADGEVPVTVKFRIGIDEKNETYLDAGRLAEEAGASSVALHARTVEQFYSGEAKWEAIANLKNAVSIPVLGNGDIFEAYDALKMMRETGADGVVVGRGCLGRPWLFKQLAEVFEGIEVTNIPDLSETVDVLLDHAKRTIEWQNSERALLGFRKHALWYTTGYGVGGNIRKKIVTAKTLSELEDTLRSVGNMKMDKNSLRTPRSHTNGPKKVAMPHEWLNKAWKLETLNENAGAISSGG